MKFLNLLGWTSACAFVLGSTTMGGVDASTKFNQTSGYSVSVSFKGWTNYATVNGGCVTCPYTCVTEDSSDVSSYYNSSEYSMDSDYTVEEYDSEISNGCCYAEDSTTTPSCSEKATPSTAESCGFLFGPSLKWKITADDQPEDALKAILYASTDCLTFWVIGYKSITATSSVTTVSGSKQINQGCYGDQGGEPIVLAGCITSESMYDSDSTYKWSELAEKCQGLSGKCAVTNANWQQNLECCTSTSEIGAAWDTSYSEYTSSTSSSYSLSGIAITGIVVGGVMLLLLLVHMGHKISERAHQTALMREQEATDDYEEIMTPLTGATNQAAPLTRQMGPSSVDVSLNEGDRIFRQRQEEVIFEGDLN